jgi:hypothetical protein
LQWNQKGTNIMAGTATRDDEEPRNGMRVESELDLVGCTAGDIVGSCCCDHQECGLFRQERWCKRLFAITIIHADFEGRALDVSAVESEIRASLASRTYEDVSFSNTHGAHTRSWDKMFVVLLAEGEPPLTTEEVESWDDYARLSVGATPFVTYMDVLRFTCCATTARKGLSHVVDLYYQNSYCGKNDLPNEGLFHRLGLKVRRLSAQSWVGNR